MTSAENKPLWYAIRVTYNREMKVKAALDSKGIASFIPMHYQDVFSGDKKIRRLVPSIHNLIFVNLPETGMKELKASSDLPIRYIMDKETGKPVTVPARQMENFIAVSSTNNDELIYLSPDELSFKQGDKVKIIGGLFEGCEGTLMRIRGDRRIVVAIPGIIAVATAFIHPSLLMKTSDPNDTTEQIS